jgi:hypothetical protein
VTGAELVPQRGHGDVDALVDEDALVAFGLELALASRQRLADPPARLADTLAGLGLGARRQGTDLTVGEGEWALLPWCAIRAALSSSSEVAAAMAESASCTAASTFAGSSAETSTGS